MELKVFVLLETPPLHFLLIVLFEKRSARGVVIV